MFLSFVANAQVWSDDINGLDSLWSYDGGGGAYVQDMYNMNDSLLFIAGIYKYANNSYVRGFIIFDKDTIQGICPFNAYGISCVYPYKNEVYLGGRFTDVCGNENIQYITTYYDNSFHQFEPINFGNEICDFCNYHDTLFICGPFSNSYFGMPGYCIVAYDGIEPIYVGKLGPSCNSLEVFNGELYAGGEFIGVKKYLGDTVWEALPCIPNNTVYELKADSINSLLFIGGQFTAVGGQESIGTCIWDGFNMIATGNYCQTTVWEQASAIYRGEYYAGCGVHYIGEDRTTFLIKWNGESWDSVGGVFSGNIFSLEVFRDTLYIGGAFPHWGGDSPVPDKRSKGLVKLYMPDNGCDYLKPRINTYADTFYLNGGEAIVNLYNNNPYVDSWEWDFGDSQTGSERNPVHTYTQVGEYNVQVTVTDGECVKTANKTIYIELGNEIKDFENIDMQIFPNPSSNDFTVRTNLPNYNNAEIKIAGLNGHLKDIIPINGETTIIPTKGWKAGVYVCNLFINGNLVRTEKLVFK